MVSQPRKHIETTHSGPGMTNARVILTNGYRLFTDYCLLITVH
jgi:hypothetical protein